MEQETKSVVDTLVVLGMEAGREGGAAVFVAEVEELALEDCLLVRRIVSYRSVALSILLLDFWLPLLLLPFSFSR